MPKKYNIEVKTAAPRFTPVGRYTTVEYREDCAGSCRACVKKKCVYEVFKDARKHISTMDDPEFLYTCMSCFRCVQECTKGIFSRVINPEYRTLGDRYWTPAIILGIWRQAHTGKIPVSGAGYRGPFVGEGFDSMWTDMSEIVRPTRDGIHGREYINTSVELSRTRLQLQFTPEGDFAEEMPPILEIPIPIMFQLPDFSHAGEQVQLATLRAAHGMGTLMFLRPGQYSDAVMPYAGSTVPCLTRDNYREYPGLLEAAPMVELADDPEIAAVIERLRRERPGLIVSVGLPLDAHAHERALALTRAEVDTVHLYADAHGNEVGAAGSPRFVKDMLRRVHLALVESNLRQQVRLCVSGGIAMAEHMAKAIICGADFVTIDLPLLIALECRVCSAEGCRENCPVKINECDPVWGARRITNLMGAWRNQLLELMGAMGIREARRLRGEVGRSMWFEDLERDNFGPIFGERKVQGIGR